MHGCNPRACTARVPSAYIISEPKIYSTRDRFYYYYNILNRDNRTFDRPAEFDDSLLNKLKNVSFSGINMSEALFLVD